MKDKPFKDATLKHYLTTSDAFLGICRAYKMEDKKRSREVWVFDVEKLNVDLVLTLVAKQETLPDDTLGNPYDDDDDGAHDPSAGTDDGGGDGVDDLPF